jgi:glycosyltransferase involved in cell wall biosynthesis
VHLCLLTSSYPRADDDVALPFLPQFVAALERRGCRVTVVAPDRRPLPNASTLFVSHHAATAASPLPLGEGQGEGVPPGQMSRTPALPAIPSPGHPERSQGSAPDPPPLEEGQREGVAPPRPTTPSVWKPSARPSAVRPILWFDWWGGQRPVVSLFSARPADLATALHLHAAAYATVALLHARDPFDHLLAAFAAPAGLVGRALRLSHRVPYSVWALGSDVHALARRRLVRPLVAWALAGADHRFADGYGLAAEAARLAGADCAFLPSGRVLPAPTPVSLQPGRRALLYLGRLEPVKGVDVLLEAFERVASRVSDLDLHVVGDGSLRSRVADAASGRLVGRLFRHEAVGAAGVAGFLAAADALVLPSRAESIPTLLVEAASAGLPCIASAVGDVPRVVEELTSGSLVPAGDAGALAAAIERWADAPRRRLPDQTRRRAIERYGPERAADLFLAALGR